MSESYSGRVPRQTRQKRAIVDALSCSTHALSIDEILQRARQQCPEISQRTVFRQIRELLDTRSIVRVFLPGEPARYERPTFEHRPHFICRRCGDVYVLPDETPDVAKLYAPPEGFEINGEELVFYGFCPECPNGKPGS